MKILRILFVLLCVAVLVYVLFVQRSDTTDAGSGETAQPTGTGLVETGAQDDAIKEEERPQGADIPEAADGDVQEECPS